MQENQAGIFSLQTSCCLVKTKLSFILYGKFHLVSFVACIFKTFLNFLCFPFPLLSQVGLLIIYNPAKFQCIWHFPPNKSRKMLSVNDRLVFFLTQSLKKWHNIFCIKFDRIFLKLLTLICVGTWRVNCINSIWTVHQFFFFFWSIQSNKCILQIYPSKFSSSVVEFRVDYISWYNFQFFE